MATCLSALGGTPIAALLLTVGLEPDPAVWKLAGTAAETGLPVLVTDLHTFEASARVREIDVDLSADDLDRAEAVMAHGAKAIDADAVTSMLAAPEAQRLSPAAFRYRLTELAKAASARIVLPEGCGAAYGAGGRRMRGAWHRPTGTPELGRGGRAGRGEPRPDAASPTSRSSILPKCPRSYVAPLAELRAHKGWSEQVARENLASPITLGTMMLQRGEVDGLVSGR